MKFFQDLLTLLSGFGLVDYILYFAVLALIILVVSLVYVMKNETRESEEVEMKREENLDMFVDSKEEEEEEIDLKAIMESINENPEPLVDMTAYENEQEQKAIISYDELVNYNRNQINYDQEELIDDVIPVKRIQSSTLELPKKFDEIQEFKLPEKEPKLEVDGKTTEEKLFSYEKEEAFLKALKELNSLLN
ncbi:MAG: hypothetical protein IJ743_03455 [Bacilli bacterium]|nr:hypothetical protein [Bacilli bacterium]